MTGYSRNVTFFPHMKTSMLLSLLLLYPFQCTTRSTLLCCAFLVPSSLTFAKKQQQQQPSSLGALRQQKLTPSFSPTTFYAVTNEELTTDSTDNNSGTSSLMENQGNNNIQGEHLDAIVCGGGPAGLLSAIMLAQQQDLIKKSSNNSKNKNKNKSNNDDSGNNGNVGRPAVIHLFDSLSEPVPVDDETAWNDFDRFYTLGVFGRGQTALEKFGVWDDVQRISQRLIGTQSWRPGTANATLSFFNTTGREPIHALPRDKLVSALYEHIKEHYADRIQLHYGCQVNPLNFEYGSDKNQVLLEITTSKSSSIADDGKSATSAQSTTKLITTNFLIGSDGTARTVANKMEQVEKNAYQSKPFWKKISAPINTNNRPFRVKRFVDDNPRVYKTLPIQIPSNWRNDVGYSAHDETRTYSIVSLPANQKGGYCAVLLMKQNETLARPDTDPKELRDMLDTRLPCFSQLLSDEQVAKVAKKPPSNFPYFRYAGPRLHTGTSTVILGDSAHSVKPYNGLGVNSAFEDVRILGDLLQTSSTYGEAIQTFSKSRAKDSMALVTMSRAGDRPGKFGFLSFLIPIIMDGFFHKRLPKLFEVPAPALVHNENYTFHEVLRRKRQDRIIQVSLIVATCYASTLLMKMAIKSLSRLVGKSPTTVTGFLFTSIIGWYLLRKKLLKPQQQ